jgi:hypothetical protein
MIVKIQRSLFSTVGPRLLIYSEDNSMRGEWPLTEEWAMRFTTDGTIGDFRFFAEVHWPNIEAPPLFIDRAPDQDW